MAEDTETRRKFPYFRIYDLRSTYGNSTQCRWCRRRVGYTTPAGRATPRCFKKYSHEITDEARGLGEDEPPSNEMALGFWHSHDSVKVFGTVLAQ